MRRVRRAMATVSTKRARSLPSSTISALSRATSVPEPMATPTLASVSAGASLMPSPSIATTQPRPTRSLIRASLSSGSRSAWTSAMPSLPPTASATDFVSPVNRMVRMRIRARASTAGLASGRTLSATTIAPSSRPSRATRISDAAFSRDPKVRDTAIPRPISSARLPTRIVVPSISAQMPRPGV